MKEGPDLARVARLVGDPARANILSALLGGRALTASELALEAGVSLPTGSSHLGKLVDGGLLTVARQGRHRYYRLSNAQVAGMLEEIMSVAATIGPQRARPGPKDAAMRHARVCYDHLAGEQGVKLFDRLLARGLLETREDTVALAESGGAFFEAAGIDVHTLAVKRRPLCRACLDWSERRWHLAGTVGRAILDKIMSDKWAHREPGSRVVAFTPSGLREFQRTFLD